MILRAPDSTMNGSLLESQCNKNSDGLQIFQGIIAQVNSEQFFIGWNIIKSEVITLHWLSGRLSYKSTMVCKARSSHFNTVGTKMVFKCFSASLVPSRFWLTISYMNVPYGRHSIVPHLIWLMTLQSFSSQQLSWEKMDKKWMKFKPWINSPIQEEFYCCTRSHFRDVILRRHIFGLFLTHLPYVSIDSNERQQLPFSEPTNLIPSRM